MLAFFEHKPLSTKKGKRNLIALPFLSFNDSPFSYSSFQTKSTFAQDCSGLPSFVPTLNLHRLKAVNAALSKLLEPLDFSTLDSTTLPSVLTKNPIETVPVSSFISAAFGYLGESHDLLSITGAVSAAIAEEAATKSSEHRSVESGDFMIIVLFVSGQYINNGLIYSVLKLFPTIIRRLRSV
ncbi:hypothetical protein ACO0KV_04560 [Undibacterium sp. RuRC25W]